MKRLIYRRTLSVFIQTNFHNFGYIIEVLLTFISTQIGFVHDKRIRNFAVFGKVVIYEKYNLSPNAVDIISFDKVPLTPFSLVGNFFMEERDAIIQYFFNGGRSWL